jgi:hypothetical protein
LLAIFLVPDKRPCYRSRLTKNTPHTKDLHMQKARWGCKAVLGMALGLSLTFAAQAEVVYSWTYTGASANGAGVDTASSGAAALITSGAFATNNGTSGLSGAWSTNTSGSPSAALSFLSGNGLSMGSDGSSGANAAIDNNGTYTEGVLLNFSKSISLTGIDLGFISGDADISVFRFTGTLAPTLNGTGTSLSAMNSAGWQLVGNYANLTQDSTSPYAYNLINGATDTDPSSGVTPSAGVNSLGSEWWLITAYSSSFGSGSNLSQGDDYFGLLGVAGADCVGNSRQCSSILNTVPEPASLALFSLALCGVVAARRQRITRPS